MSLVVTSILNHCNGTKWRFTCRCAPGLLLAAMLLAGFASPSKAEAPDANAIKADMLCNMAKFVQWPEGVFTQNPINQFVHRVTPEITAVQ